MAYDIDANAAEIEALLASLDAVDEPEELDGPLDPVRDYPIPLRVARHFLEMSRVELRAGGFDNAVYFGARADQHLSWAAGWLSIDTAAESWTHDWETLEREIGAWRLELRAAAPAGYQGSK